MNIKSIMLNSKVDLSQDSKSDLVLGNSQSYNLPEHGINFLVTVLCLDSC